MPESLIPEQAPARPKRPKPRNRLVAAERIVKIAGGIVGVIAALVTLYLKVPDILDRLRPAPESTQAAPAQPGPSPALTATPEPTPSAGSKPPDNNRPPDNNQPADNDQPAVDDGLDRPVPTPPKPAPGTSYHVFSLSVPPGIAYDLENTSNYGWSGDDPGYADRDLYRTSKTSPGNRFQGVQVPVTSQSFNPVRQVAAGSSPSVCAQTPKSGGGSVSLDSAGEGTTFCVRTRAGHWAHVVITAMAGGTPRSVSG